MPREGGNPSASAALRIPVLALACVALVACGSVYGRLRPESEIPECRDWLEAIGDAPPVVRFVPTGSADGRIVRVALEEHGTGDRARVDVLIHGLLSDSRTWRYVAAGLAREHDVLLVDLPGCGRSDKPDPAAVGDDAYAPTALARHALAALREYQAAHPVRPRITLVGHSLGTAVVLRMLGAPELRGEFRDVLADVDRAVLLAPLAFAFENPDPRFDRIAGLTSVGVTLAEVTGLLRGSVADTVWAGADDPATVPREEADRLLEILSGGETLRAGQAMIRTVVPFRPDRRCDWERIEELEADYANVSVPCLLVCGGRDETLPQAMGFRLRELLPHAWLRVLPRAKHMLPTERPRDCVRLIAGFDTTAGDGWAAFEDVRRHLAPAGGGVTH